MWVRSLAQEDALEEGLATHSSIFAWRILWTEEPRRLWSTGLKRIRQECSDLAHMHPYIKFLARNLMQLALSK